MLLKISFVYFYFYRFKNFFVLCKATNFLIMLNPESNIHIVRLLRKGDIECFEDVFKYYFKPLCAFASQYVSTEIAEGIVQETMMWLWENKETIIEEMSLKSLLFTIVKNKSLNKVKALQVRTRVHSDIIKKYKEQFENPNFYLENELYELYSRAINKLPDTCREAFLMSREQQLTHKEIAEILKVSPQTVNYRLGKALEILRVELKDYLPLLFLLFTSSNI